VSLDPAGNSSSDRRRVVDAAVTRYAQQLAAALDSGNVAEIEAVFYAVFDEIYTDGYQQGFRAAGGASQEAVA